MAAFFPLAPSAFKRRCCLLCQLSPSANMPPVQATSRPFSDNCHSTLTFTYVILSLSFIFILLFFCWSTIRRHHPKHDNAHAAHFSATFSPPHLLSNEEWKAKRASTVSTLSSQSTIASTPLHLNVISEIRPPPPAAVTFRCFLA